MVKTVGGVVIFKPGMVRIPCESALPSPWAAPKVQRKVAPGCQLPFWILRTETSAVDTLGISKVVFSLPGSTRKSDISRRSLVSLRHFQRKKALTCPALELFRSAGHGILLLLLAQVKTG